MTIIRSINPVYVRISDILFSRVFLFFLFSFYHIFYANRITHFYTSPFLFQ